VAAKTNEADGINMHDEMRRGFALLSGKWKLEIMWLLNQQIYRFGGMRKAIPGITQHMLTAQLRELKADGWVPRTVFAEVPPRVEYGITAKARGSGRRWGCADRLVERVRMKPAVEAGRTWAESQSCHAEGRLRFATSICGSGWGTVRRRYTRTQTEHASVPRDESCLSKSGHRDVAPLRRPRAYRCEGSTRFFRAILEEIAAQMGPRVTDITWFQPCRRTSLYKTSVNQLDGFPCVARIDGSEGYSGSGRGCGAIECLPQTDPPTKIKLD
jgi:DNA-binding HxlR family transcriptional regulator